MTTLQHERAGELARQHLAHMERLARMSAPRPERRVRPVKIVRDVFAERRRAREQRIEEFLRSAAEIKARWQVILDEVARKHGIPTRKIIGTERSRDLLPARYEYIYRLRTELGWSLPQIGRRCGGRDHTTILNALRRHCRNHGLPLASNGVGQPTGARWQTGAVNNPAVLAPDSRTGSNANGEAVLHTSLAAEMETALERGDLPVAAWEHHG